jgi:DNA repair exonuclease SbcCD nuclease subunit
MPGFRFIHAADVHLDSPLRGLSRYDGVPAEQVRLATRTALGNLVETAITEEVSFVIIAGDVFDGNWDDFCTGLFFCAQMGKLNRHGIDVYMVRGNHDADSNMTKRLPLPLNVKVFSHRKAEHHVHEPTGAVLHGQSYAERDPKANLSLNYGKGLAGCFNALGGNYSGHEPYSPCSLEDLAAREYDYWALGHIHQFQHVCPTPHVVFPGNLQGRDIREAGPKGAVIVTVNDGSVESVERIYLDAVRWCSIEVDLSGAEQLGEVDRRVTAAAGAAFDSQADGRPLLIRLTLSGVTPLHSALTNMQTILREEVRALAAGVSDTLWIEKTSLRTRAPAEPGGDHPMLLDIADLLDEARADATLLDALKQDYGDLLSRLPADGIEGELVRMVRDGDVSSILAEGATALKAHLRGAGF